MVAKDGDLGAMAARPGKGDVIKEGWINICIIKGVEGLSIYINNTRICGNKPWGGGSIVQEWNVPLDCVTRALPTMKPQPVRR